jgi:hypothetical protein
MCEITKALKELKTDLKADISANEKNLKEFTTISLEPIKQSGEHTYKELKTLNSKVAKHELRLQDLEKYRVGRATDCPNLNVIHDHNKAIDAINSYIKTKDAVEAEREKQILATAAALEKKTARRLYVLFGVSTLVIASITLIINIVVNLLLNKPG